MLDVTIADLCPDDLPACARILQSLPEWFGIPAANAAYIRSLADLPTFVARCQADVVGFAALKPHNPGSIEVYVIAVDAGHDRQGIGGGLVRQGEVLFRAGGFRLVHVKSVCPSRPDPSYAQTRRFYADMGFDPLFETECFWGPENPALVLVKRL